jgi:hypothetical protein
VIATVGTNAANNTLENGSGVTGAFFGATYAVAGDTSSANALEEALAALPVRECATGAAILTLAGPRGFGPLRLEAPDGRVTHFQRAMADFRTADGRSGVGWIEWNINQH